MCCCFSTLNLIEEGIKFSYQIVKCGVTLTRDIWQHFPSQTRLLDGDSQIFRLLVFGPSGFWTMAPLRYAAKFDIWQPCSKDPSKDPSTLSSSSSKRGPCKRVQEIVTASGVTCLHDPETKVQSYSPKQGRRPPVRFPPLMLTFRLLCQNSYT